MTLLSQAYIKDKTFPWHWVRVLNLNSVGMPKVVPHFAKFLYYLLQDKF